MFCSFLLLAALASVAVATDRSECEKCVAQDRVWCADQCGVSSASSFAFGARSCKSSCSTTEQRISSCDNEDPTRTSTSSDCLSLNEAVGGAIAIGTACLAAAIAIPICICLCVIAVIVVVVTQSNKGGQKGTVIVQQPPPQQVQYVQAVHDPNAPVVVVS